eukprot:TRINITY_DN9503_c0_g1_i1.p2 TRINITY_DN9503_c0_g1~~TRINITY_DN9503_c0_g1_i1.p2  ORF type:complete len:552 (+),score=13.72 TRINITY_DN9503_c0_g1_i1:114-1769(+)
MTSDFAQRMRSLRTESASYASGYRPTSSLWPYRGKLYPHMASIVSWLPPLPEVLMRPLLCVHMFSLLMIAFASFVTPLLAPSSVPVWALGFVPFAQLPLVTRLHFPAFAMMVAVPLAFAVRALRSAPDGVAWALLTLSALHTVVAGLSMIFFTTPPFTALPFDPNLPVSAGDVAPSASLTSDMPSSPSASPLGVTPEIPNVDSAIRVRSRKTRRQKKRKTAATTPTNEPVAYADAPQTEKVESALSVTAGSGNVSSIPNATEPTRDAATTAFVPSAAASPEPPSLSDNKGSEARMLVHTYDEMPAESRDAVLEPAVFHTPDHEAHLLSQANDIVNGMPSPLVPPGAALHWFAFAATLAILGLGAARHVSRSATPVTPIALVCTALRHPAGERSPYSTAAVVGVGFGLLSAAFGTTSCLHGAAAIWGTDTVGFSPVDRGLLACLAATTSTTAVLICGVVSGSGQASVPWHFSAIAEGLAAAGIIGISWAVMSVVASAIGTLPSLSIHWDVFMVTAFLWTPVWVGMIFAVQRMLAGARAVTTMNKTLFTASID